MANNKPMEQWDLNDFLQFYTENTKENGLFSRKPKENSAAFEQIKQMALELKEIDSREISHDMLYDRSQKLQELMGATFEYVNTHLNPRTPNGIERRDVANAFMKFCQKEKAFSEFGPREKYFAGKTLDDMRKGVPYSELEKLEEQIEKFEWEPVTEENVIKITHVLDRYIQGAEIYIKTPFINTETEWKKGNVQKLLNQYKPAISAIRDMRAVRSVLEKYDENDLLDTWGESKKAIWDELLQLREAKAVFTGKKETVGANVSQRLKMTYNGKEGFFTEETFAAPRSVTIDNYIAKNNKTKEDVLIAKNRDILDGYSLSIQEAIPENDNAYVTVCKAWEQMEKSEEKRKLQNLLSSKPDDALRAALGDAFKKYSSCLEQISKDGKNVDQSLKTKALLEALPQNVTSELRQTIKENAGVLTSLVEKGPQEVKNNRTAFYKVGIESKLYYAMMTQETKTNEGKELYQVRREMLDNSKALTEASQLLQQATGLHTIFDQGHLDKRDRTELSSRNVATSRLAELLGIGNLIAHAETMTVTIDGKEVKGCFMEFAEGFDMGGGTDFTKMKVASQTVLNTNGTLARDASNLAIFDILCGQVDRHAGNLFTQVSEPGKDGKRKVVGIQGIDNDAAFTRIEDIDGKGRTSKIDQLVFVDAKFAKTLRTLTREQVEYAVGDLLNSAEIDGFMKRVERVNQHINDKEKVFLLSGSQWDLDAYSINMNTSNLDEKSKRYVNKLKSIQRGIHVPADRIPNNESKAIYGVKLSQDQYKELDEKFNSAMVKKSDDAVRAKRAAIFDKMVSEKGQDAKKSSAPEAEVKTNKTQAKTSFNELSAQQKATEKTPISAQAKAKAKAKAELANGESKDVTKSEKKSIFSRRSKK